MAVIQLPPLSGDKSGSVLLTNATLLQPLDYVTLVTWDEVLENHLKADLMNNEELTFHIPHLSQVALGMTRSEQTIIQLITQ